MSELFLNQYICPHCGEFWDDTWDSMVDDECSFCGTKNISPVKSEKIYKSPRDILLDFYMENPSLTCDLDYESESVRLETYKVIINNMTNDDIMQELKELKK